MIRFILNHELIRTDASPGLPVLDWIRYHAHLKGTKIGCREGDCGACTILIGELAGGCLRYRSATSCLTALGNIQNKHLVTVEGLNGEGLNPLQAAMAGEGGTQCGFCTPGFIVSMAGHCLSGGASGKGSALAAVDGNICRCTGYHSILRALEKVESMLSTAPVACGAERMDWLVEKGVLPAWFMRIRERLGMLEDQGLAADGSAFRQEDAVFLGGGTDLYVQQHERMPEAAIRFLYDRPGMNGIVSDGHWCEIGGGVTVTDLMESGVIRGALPAFPQYMRLISSTPIRNIATVAGNFVNASPIGDLSIIFLALGARLVMNDGHAVRELPLRELFLGYKVLDKRPGEWIERIRFELPREDEYFHFEKVSKRRYLDIASVNTAVRLRMKEGFIVEGMISAGGVGPIPAVLRSASSALAGRQPDEALVSEVVSLAMEEIDPISDVRGTAAYKRLLLGQLIRAHFITLFPGKEAGMICRI